ncbi:unnamed protein product [Arabidopsis lyrata]|uniref:F-box associated beta-propeller type 1 domain-containing protein n=1 Tax=Arabidopsis lyrata subsp. lyrata TaxID=81972 RepID=D7KXJ6_ARALL|nr:hypothetical protein ARALYDRAFT_894769 [Arabidopsis lyrata subsp. lyrata]CAH8257638.1 unnamed protein product [Arabidopsis lyrata]
MASEKLPWGWVEEILSWVPLRSLIHQQGNNQLTRASRPQFILFVESNIFSVDFILNDCPSIEVQKFPLDIPGYRLSIPLTVDYCDGLLLRDTLNYGLAVCNPLLKQTKWNIILFQWHKIPNWLFQCISFYDFRFLQVFRKDRFSYLHQCYETKNIEIWVTKRKIENVDGEAVEWIKFMNVSVPNSSGLKYMYVNNQRSYFIDDISLSLVVYCWDYTGQVYIYIARLKKLK